MKWWTRGGLLLVLVLAMALAFVGCSEESDDDDPVGPSPEPPYEAKQVQGVVDLPAGVPGNVGDMEVVGFAGRGDVGDDGNFNVDVVDQADGPMMFFLTQAGNAFPVLIGLLEDEDGTINFTVETTAVALALLNPNLFGTTVSDREDYVQAVRDNPDFQGFVDMLTAVYAADGVNALDFELNPELYQALAELMRSTLENMGQQIAELDEVAPPYLMDGEAGMIYAMNPTFTTYGAGIFQNDSWQATHPVGRRMEDVVGWAWPPMMAETEAQSEIPLADGDYRVHLTKGPDFANLGDFDNPGGMATLMNSSTVILSISDLIVGQLPLYPDAVELAGRLNISQAHAAEITRGITQKDETGTLVAYLDVVNANSQNIADWMWNDTEALAADIYLSLGSMIMRNVAFTFDLLFWENSTGPFIYDLVNAPEQLDYVISVSDGVIGEIQEDMPPMAMFYANPPAGVIETQFVFDASGTEDDFDLLEDLEFRWDVDGDGTWDSNWSSDPTFSHSYDATGSYNIVLEVRDTSGLVGKAGGVVNVGGGAGTADHVKLFRDALPWSSDAMDEMLQSLGYTEGQGPNTYEILSSDQMATVELNPGEDLVIISNDQATYFYENYAANQTRFNNFVYMGGSLFWEACDLGWANGSMEDAGVILPGNVGFEYNYDNWNYVVAPNLPLVAGLPTELDHNYASHESFVNLVLGTTVYCEDSVERPTLIEYSLGGGWVLMSGQPLEHQYDNQYGQEGDMSQLLPRIVAYFLGEELPATAPMGTPGQKVGRSSAGVEVSVK